MQVNWEPKRRAYKQAEQSLKLRIGEIEYSRKYLKLTISLNPGYVSTTVQKIISDIDWGVKISFFYRYVKKSIINGAYTGYSKT